MVSMIYIYHDLQAGAQPHLLGALSARLAVYEAAEAAATVSAPSARPSTRGALRLGTAGDGWGQGKAKIHGENGENMGKMGFQCGFDEESHWVNRVKNAIFNQFGMVGKTWRVCALKRCFGVSVIYNPLFTPVRSSQVATPAKTSLLSNAQTVEIGGLSSCLKIAGTDLPMVQNINDHHTGSNRYMVLTGKTIT